MTEKNKLPESVRKLPKDQQAKALLHAALASKMFKEAGKKNPAPEKKKE